MANEILSAQDALNRQVLGKTGVHGTAIGLHGGSPCLKVYVRDAGTENMIPKRIKGFSVVVEVTEGFRRF